MANPPAADAASQSPASPQRLARARARARALGQRTPYTMSVEERLLIDRLIERDEQAFSEIVRLYGDKVFSLIYRMLGNRQEAEDVAQDVFITVFKTIESFRGEAKFSTWLLRIAANHAKNRIKHLARRPTEGVDPEDVSQVRASVDRPPPPVQARMRARTPCWKRPRPRGSCRSRSRSSPRTSASWSCFATSRRCPTRRSKRLRVCRKAR